MGRWIAGLPSSHGACLAKQGVPHCLSGGGRIRQIWGPVPSPFLSATSTPQCLELSLSWWAARCWPGCSNRGAVAGAPARVYSQPWHRQAWHRQVCLGQRGWHPQALSECLVNLCQVERRGSGTGLCPPEPKGNQDPLSGRCTQLPRTRWFRQRPKRAADSWKPHFLLGLRARAALAPPQETPHPAPSQGKTGERVGGRSPNIFL